MQLGDPDALGLDAIFPAFFFGLLLNEIKSRRARGVAALGTVIALALVPFTPPGRARARGEPRLARGAHAPGAGGGA